MQRLICFLVALAIAHFSLAQSSDTDPIFKKFKVDVSLGYTVPTGSSPGANFSGGVLFAIEPKYAPIDPLAIGIRFEEAAIVHEYNNNNSNNSNQSNGIGNLSMLATGDYYFTNTGFRPFIGAGAGVFVVENVDSSYINGNSTTIPTASRFGFMVRGGFEASHFRLGIEYNIVGLNASYLGLKVGVCIGGGRKNPAN
jgi:outer membrane protein W